MPEQFWGLTVREFHLKHAAFTRAEGRLRALVYEIGLNTKGCNEKEQRRLTSNIRALRQYPIKPWLRSR